MQPPFAPQRVWSKAAVVQALGASGRRAVLGRQVVAGFPAQSSQCQCQYPRKSGVASCLFGLQSSFLPPLPSSLPLSIPPPSLPSSPATCPYPSIPTLTPAEQRPLSSLSAPISPPPALRRSSSQSSRRTHSMSTSSPIPHPHSTQRQSIKI